MARQYNDRFMPYTPSQISVNNGKFQVDENNDGITDYQFSKPDFNFVQFRSNMVVRWEYRPGSELFLVWAQGNTADAFNELDTPIFQSFVNNAFSGGNNRNTILVKWTYRFLR